MLCQCISVAHSVTNQQGKGHSARWQTGGGSFWVAEVGFSGTGSRQQQQLQVHLNARNRGCLWQQV